MNATARKPTVVYICKRAAPASLSYLHTYEVIGAVGKERSTHLKLRDAMDLMKKNGWTPAQMPAEEGFPDDMGLKDLTPAEWKRVVKAFKLEE